MGRVLGVAMSSERERLEAFARERKVIEIAITILSVYRGRLTEGQVKELKRIIYYVAEP